VKTSIIKTLRKYSTAMMLITVILLSSKAFSANYVVTGFTIDKIKVYKQGWAIVSLTTEASNLSGCTGTWDGKGAGYYFYVSDTNTKLYDTIATAHINNTAIDIGLFDTCVSWSGTGMAIPEVYRIDF